MDIWEGIDSIRVVREFEQRSIPDEHLQRILNAGRRAGSSKNLQRWAFVLIRDKERLTRLAAAGPFSQHVGGAAAAIALVTPNPRADGQPLSVMWDLGRAAQNMVLTAWQLGIGSCPATVYEHEVVHKELAVPDGHHCEYILSFGYPAHEEELRAPNRAGGRARLEEVVHEETW